MAMNRKYDDSADFGSKLRQNIFRTIVILVAIVYIVWLGYLQIIKGNIYRDKSEAQAIKTVVVDPFRGNIFDRNGELLVHNEPSFTITLTKNDFIRESSPLLCSILGKEKAFLDSIYAANTNVSRFTPIKIVRDIDFETVALIEEYDESLPGIDIIIESKRLYDFDGRYAHMMGYTREVTRAQLNRRPYLRSGDIIGQNGLEKMYDQMLRGKKGVEFVAVNKVGKKVASFENGKSDIPPVNGFDLYLTIDRRMQERAEKLLEGKRGAIVVVDPNSGEVLTLASKPDFDPRQFSGKIPRELYNALRDDQGFPLLHRAIQSRYPPGSTWKMLVALAGLQEGLITTNSTFYCKGYLKFGGRNFKCHGAHGNTNVNLAIKASCNVFFYELALKLGFKRMAEYGRMFGFGDRAELDLPNEKKGLMPDTAWLLKRFGDNALKQRGRLVNYGIGQGEILVTPLQMAVYTAVLANGGTYYQPHVVKDIHNNITDKKEPLAFDSREIPIDKKYFDIIKKGMFGVVNLPGGTASYARLAGHDICGKTGTAQNPHGKDHAWFVCFAPKDDPQIAMCVFVENAGFGGSVSAPIARKMIETYYGLDTIKYNAPLIEDAPTADTLQITVN
jgi:penicillin-binding protein 2